VKNKVQERLNEIGRSQGWLSRETGYSREYINKIISGKVPNPGIDACKKIAKALGRYVEELWL
jgi:DNA-binding XRE family transcriptional regulator